MTKQKDRRIVRRARLAACDSENANACADGLPGRMVVARLWPYIVVWLTILSFTGVTQARYLSRVSGHDDISVARACLSFVGEAPALTDFMPGETRRYTFAVTNRQDEQVTQVPLRYYFVLEAADSGARPIDLAYDLYCLPEGRTTLRHVGMSAAQDNRTNPVDMAAGEPVTHTFFLDINWRPTQTDAETYAGRSGKIRIAAHVEQVNEYETNEG